MSRDDSDSDEIPSINHRKNTSQTSTTAPSSTSGSTILSVLTGDTSCIESSTNSEPNPYKQKKLPIITPNAHRFTQSDGEKRVRFMIDDRILTPQRGYVDPFDLSKDGLKKQTQKIHKDTQQATKRWLCKAKRSSRFKNDINDMLQVKDSTLLLVGRNKNIDNNKVSNDKLNKYKSSDLWFTQPSDSPNSIESHESFWDEQIDELQDNPDCIALQDFADDTHNQLRQEIMGKWTRRFVQKRTKPKVLNALHRERLNLLLRFLEDNDDVWSQRENVYVNLSARVRLHWDSAYQWFTVLNYYRDNNDKIAENVQLVLKQFTIAISKMLSNISFKSLRLFYFISLR